MILLLLNHLNYFLHRVPYLLSVIDVLYNMFNSLTFKNRLENAFANDICLRFLLHIFANNIDLCKYRDKQCMPSRGQ